MYLIALEFNLFSGSLQARSVDVMLVLIHTEVLELFNHNHKLEHKAHALWRNRFTVINWLCKWRQMSLFIGAHH
jgi:hypothetical protein